MIIYPAIDIKDGKCVRLYKGDMERDTVYNESPPAQAMDWAKAGFSWLHVVDLNGAIAGAPANHRAVRDIIKSVDLPVQLGGGIRSMAQMERWFNEGVSRIILGTAAVKDPEFLKQACYEFPDQIVVGIDALNGEVMVDGWVEGGGVQALDLVQKLQDIGVSRIIYTDINRDGTGQGINMISTIELAQSVDIPVIASGGAHSLEDLENVKAAAKYGVEGVILGRALYDKDISPADALKIAS